MEKEILSYSVSRIIFWTKNSEISVLYIYFHTTPWHSVINKVMSIFFAQTHYYLLYFLFFNLRWLSVSQLYLHPGKDCLSLSIIYNKGKQFLDLVTKLCNFMHHLIILFSFSVFFVIIIIVYCFADLQRNSWGRSVDCWYPLISLAKVIDRKLMDWVMGAHSWCKYVNFCFFVLWSIMVALCLYYFYKLETLQ